MPTPTGLAVTGKPDYYLSATLIVRRKDVGDFMKQAKAILAEFTKMTGFVLRVAASRPINNDFHSDPKGELVEVFNLWDITTANDLLDGMIKLADFPAYAALDALVVRADQDIVVALPRLGQVGRQGFSEDQTCFGRRRASQHGMSNSYSGDVLRRKEITKRNSLDEVMAQMEERPERDKATGLQLVGGFLNLTGTLNQVTWVWKGTGKRGEKPETTPKHLLVRTPWDDEMDSTVYQPCD
jgi:hypothetical protein